MGPDRYRSLNSWENQSVVLSGPFKPLVVRTALSSSDWRYGRVLETLTHSAFEWGAATASAEP